MKDYAQVTNKSPVVGAFRDLFPTMRLNTGQEISRFLKNAQYALGRILDEDPTQAQGENALCKSTQGNEGVEGTQGDTGVNEHVRLGANIFGRSKHGLRVFTSSLDRFQKTVPAIVTRFPYGRNYQLTLPELCQRLNITSGIPTQSIVIQYVAPEWLKYPRCKPILDFEPSRIVTPSAVRNDWASSLTREFRYENN
jgi:hypothetical protein